MLTVFGKTGAIGTGFGSTGGKAVHADGWYLTDYPNPPTFDPIGDPQYVDVTRNGFDASGDATTVTDNLIIMSRKRKPYPDQAENTDDEVALQNYIYSGDTVEEDGAALTNSSTRTYEKPQCCWINEDLDIATSTTYTVRLFVFHSHARSGRPVAAVKFTATDGTTTVESTVSSMSTISYTAGGKTIPHFSAAMDISTLNTGVLITFDAVIYPWAGSSFTISSDGDTYPRGATPVLKVLNDSDDGYGQAHAYVDGVGGSPAVASTKAGASSTPYATVAAAMSAIQTYNNSNNSRNNVDAAKIWLTNTTHVYGSTAGQTVNLVPPTILAEDVANKATTILQDSGANLFNGMCDYLRIEDITLQKTAGSITFLDSAATAGSDHRLIIKNCTFDINGQTQYSAWVHRVGRLYLIDCDGDDINQALTQTADSKEIISIGSADGSVGNGGTKVLHALGCVDPDGWFTTNVDGGCYAFNHVQSTANPVITDGNANISDRGMAFVGNTLEKITSAVQPAMDYDLLTKVMQNVNIFCNTILGARFNLGYQSTAGVAKSGHVKFNVIREINTKGDVTNTDGTLVENWPIHNKVGWLANTYIYGDGTGDTFGAGKQLGEYAEIGNVSGTDASPVTLDLANDQSLDGGNTSTLSDVTPGASNALSVIPSGEAPLSNDQAGTAIANDGTAEAGALQQ